MTTLISSCPIPVAGLLTILKNLNSSFTKDGSSFVDIVMLGLFIVGCLLVVKGFMNIRKQQPPGYFIASGIGAMIVSAVFYGKFDKIHSTFNNHANGIVDDALTGKG